MTAPTRVLWIAIVLSGIVPASGRAQDQQQPSVFDKPWRAVELYRSDSNRVVQRVALSGRYHHDFLTLHAAQGEHEEQNVRRLRIGPRVTFFRDFTFHTEFEVDPQEHEPFYLRLTDAYIEWSRDESLAITVGKQSMPFTMDGATSSRNLLTIDRSNFSNNIWFPQEYLPGVSASGEVGRWAYHVGVFSAGSANREFGEFNGSVATLISAGYDFGDALGVDGAVLSANYVYQNPDANNTFTRQLDHISSINFNLSAGRWGARTDLAVASGYLGQSSVWGVMLMPYLNVTRELQLVGRYTFLDSADVNGVRLATYESRLVGGRGDRYNEIYGGANYYFYGHRLKLQTGLQWADMSDRANDGGEYQGVAWVTGLRVGW